MAKIESKSFLTVVRTRRLISYLNSRTEEKVKIDNDWNVPTVRNCFYVHIFENIGLLFIVLLLSFKFYDKENVQSLYKLKNKRKLSLT